MQRTCHDLVLLRNGTYDPTTRITTSGAVGSVARVERATLTPDGPGTVAIDVGDDGDCVVRAWGPGADWLRSRVGRLTARATAFRPVQARHEALRRAVHLVGHLRLPASDTPYHEALPAVLGQRITAVQASRQWASLCLRHGEAAPGTLGLRLPPTPERILAIPVWEFHRLGIEEQRARTLRVVARHARFVDSVRELDAEAARAALVRLPGVGAWTAAITVGVSHGDPDALPIGDFHVKNTVAHALTGRLRGTDEQMLATLAPYTGQRWQVVRTLEKAGFAAPRLGPRRRILDISRL